MEHEQRIEQGQDTITCEYYDSEHCLLMEEKATCSGDERYCLCPSTLKDAMRSEHIGY